MTQGSHVCHNCPMTGESGKLTEILERLAATSAKLEAVVDRLDRNSEASEKTQDAVHRLDVRVSTLEARADTSWKLVSVIAVAVAAVAQCAAWLYSQLTKH